MTTLVSNQQNIQPINSAQLVGIFKAIAPRSFEKTFDGMPIEAINNAMKICIEGLSRDEINTGLCLVRDNGFCPDPAMFRKWCLGITGFGTEQQRAVDSFKGKHAALANVVAWRVDNTQVITNAEREAYARSSQLFSSMDYASNHERAAFYAYEAFKDNYTAVVQEFVEQGVGQSNWDQQAYLKERKKHLAELKTLPCTWGDIDTKKTANPASAKNAQEHLENLRKLIKQNVQDCDQAGDLA